MIGVQCVLLGGVSFDPLYWQTACLLQRSGSLDGKSANYNKVAKAVSQLAKLNVKIRPLDINNSDITFTLDIKKQIIHFGFEGVKGLKTATINSIIENRPYTSFYDFLGRTQADVTSVVTLIKAGAFDEFGTRQEMVYNYSRYKAETKMKLNGQNFSTLLNLGLFPNETEELELARKIFIFTNYLKAISKNSEEVDSTEYLIDDAALNFLQEIDYTNDGHALNKVSWKAAYDIYMLPVKQYLIDHQEEMLEKVNNKILEDWREKYFPSKENESLWEIQTMGLCFGEHPMSNVVNGIVDFYELPQEPEIASFYRTKTGKNIPLYKLDMIAGIVVAKDKLHSTATVLTSTGPVDVKFRKEQFASYDSQISKKVNGKKEIIERSWLNRGGAVIIHGMRQGDLFTAKTYRNSPMKHTCYKITDIIENGTKFTVQKERKKGFFEESEDDNNE